MDTWTIKNTHSTPLALATTVNYVGL